MATSTHCGDRTRRRGLRLTPVIPLGAAAAALPLLLPHQARANEGICGRADLNLNRESSGAVQTLSVTAAGKQYILCTITTSPDNAILRQTPWFQEPGTSLASDLAAAILEQHSALVNSATHQSPDTKTTDTNWFHDGINNPTGLRGSAASVGDGPYFLRSVDKAAAYQIRRNGFLCRGGSVVNNSCNIAQAGKTSGSDLVFVLGAPSPSAPAPQSVPGPLPLVGAAAAFAWSRPLRRRLQSRPTGPAQATRSPLQAPASCVSAQPRLRSVFRCDAPR